MPNYPGSLDSLTNPAAGDPTTSPAHHTQHGTANDILEAIEAKLGITATGSGYSTTPIVGYEFAAASPTGTTAWRADVVVDPRDYGAFPNSGANEAAHIQAAIDACAAFGGGVVRLLPGMYLVSSQVTISTSGVILEGAGAGQTTIFKSSGSTSPVVINTVDGASTKISGSGVRRMTVDGNGVANYAIRLTTVSYSDVQMVTAQGGVLYQVYMNTWDTRPGGGDARDNQHNLLRDLRLYATGSQGGIKLHGPTDPIVGTSDAGNTSLNRFDNIFVSMTGTPTGVGFNFGDSDGNCLTHLRIFTTGTPTGLRFSAGIGATGTGHARHNMCFNVQTAGAPVVAQGTDVNATPSGPNFIGLNRGNGTALPTIGPSASVHVVTDDGYVSATQVAFDATQSASSDPNTLDDYEEGTFTPALVYATPGTSTWATTTATGFYTKIGRCVYINGVYNGVPTNGTASGNMTMSGLPFTSNATANSGSAITVAMQGYTKAGYTVITGIIPPSFLSMQFRGNGTGVANANLTVTDIPTAGTVIIQFNGFYIV